MNESSPWQPIESAPKDGSAILIYHPEGGVCEGFCSGEGFAWQCMDGTNTVTGTESGLQIPRLTAFIASPTHWMPLPPAPGDMAVSLRDEPSQPEQPGDSDHVSRAVPTKDALVSPFPVIRMGFGTVEVGDATLEGLPCLWFGNDGQGMGVERVRKNAARDGETLVAITFANIGGLEAIELAVARLRESMTSTPIHAASNGKEANRAE